MKKINKLIRDFTKCITIGTGISLGIMVVVGISSLFLSRFNLNNSIQIVRSALLIIGPLGLVLSAILILKNREEKEFLFIDQWKRKYSIFSYKIVLIVVSCTIILYGGIVDWFIINFK